MTAAHLPVWPFAILLLLLALGHRLSRTRLVRPRAAMAMALAMLVFSLAGVVASFGARPWPLLAWAAGLAAVLVLGREALAPRGLLRQGRQVRVPGSWWPMGLLMGIFIAKFVLGWGQATSAPWLQHAWSGAAAGALFGVLSGAFAARSLAVQRLASVV